MMREDYVRMTHSFGRHLQHRGHDAVTSILLFKEAALHIESKESIISLAAREATSDHATDPDDHLLFLHAEYHPKRIPRPTIRQLYNRTITKSRLFDGFIVSYHGPRNLRDLLSLHTQNWKVALHFRRRRVPYSCCLRAH
jgi:hypothetical protein